MSKLMHKLVVRDDSPEFEQVVYGEILVPDDVNTFNEVWTAQGVREAMYAFARKGFGIDVEHDENDVSADRKVYVVESFIARAGDPDFVEGAWVVGMKIDDPDIWASVLSGELNGFSYQAIITAYDILLPDTGTTVVSGVTEPDLFDGHSHVFTVIVDTNGRVVAGGTDEVDGHSHVILTHTVTEEQEGHRHRFQITESFDE